MTKIETEHIKPNIKVFSEEQLRYLDYERMDETLTRITFEKTPYSFFAKFLKYQYKLPVKYLEPEIENCWYISQKTYINTKSKNITDAEITIEPLNQNVFKQISYTPINQGIELGTIVTLYEKIPYTNPDGTIPSRRLLTSASLDCSFKGLCNRCIPYTAIDVGSEISGKFTVKTNPLRESMALYHFRRPKDNILEIITADYLNITPKYVFKLTKEEILKREPNTEKEIIKILDDIISKL